MSFDMRDKFPCSDFWTCKNTNKAHKDRFLHPCKDTKNGKKCYLQDVVHHYQNFMHPCPRGKLCPLGGFHLKLYYHEDPPKKVVEKEIWEKKRCPKFDICSDVSSGHTSKYYHPCKYGEKCRHQYKSHGEKSRVHCKRFQHPCRKGKYCSDSSSRHKIEFFHEGSRWGLSVSDIPIVGSVVNYFKEKAPKEEKVEKVEVEKKKWKIRRVSEYEKASINMMDGDVDLGAIGNGSVVVYFEGYTVENKFMKNLSRYLGKRLFKPFEEFQEDLTFGGKSEHVLWKEFLLTEATSKEINVLFLYSSKTGLKRERFQKLVDEGIKQMRILPQGKPITTFCFGGNDFMETLIRTMSQAKPKGYRTFNVFFQSNERMELFELFLVKKISEMSVKDPTSGHFQTTNRDSYRNPQEMATMMTYNPKNYSPLRIPKRLHRSLEPLSVREVDRLSERQNRSLEPVRKFEPVTKPTVTKPTVTVHQTDPNVLQNMSYFSPTLTNKSFDPFTGAVSSGGGVSGNINQRQVNHQNMGQRGNNHFNSKQGFQKRVYYKVEGKEDCHIKVMSINILAQSYIKFSTDKFFPKGKRLKQVFEMIINEDCDIVGVQEVDELGDLYGLTSVYNYRGVKKTGKNDCVAVLYKKSRFIETHSMELPNDHCQLVALWDKKFKKVVIFGSTHLEGHPQKFQIQQRQCTNNLNNFLSLRIEAMKAAGESGVQNLKENTVSFFTGDLNAEQNSTVWKTFHEFQWVSSQDAYMLSRGYTDFGISFKTKTLAKRIDFVWFCESEKNVQVVGSTLGKIPHYVHLPDEKFGTDHIPIISYFNYL